MEEKKLKKEEVCENCNGTGYVSCMEQVYPGEPHMADVGEEPCPDCNGPDDYIDMSGATEGDR